MIKETQVKKAIQNKENLNAQIAELKAQLETETTIIKSFVIERGNFARVENVRVTEDGEAVHYNISFKKFPKNSVSATKVKEYSIDLWNELSELGFAKTGESSRLDCRPAK
jgi:hypothetical protein